MCYHEYKNLGKLLVYTNKNEDRVLDMHSADKGTHATEKYYIESCNHIYVFQCIKCGDVLINSGVFDKICQGK